MKILDTWGEFSYTLSMAKFILASGICFAMGLLFIPYSLSDAQAPAPLLTPATAHASPANEPPVEVSIPSIELDSPVVPVGINRKGEMDVPDGATKDVGWYAKGTMPGDEGSAVFAAHVYAAFNKLHKVQVGSDIYVTRADGETLRFVVKKTKTFKLKDLSSKELFKAEGGKYLHLITCAGKPTGSTYTHRLVVFAELVE